MIEELKKNGFKVRVKIGLDGRVVVVRYTLVPFPFEGGQPDVRKEFLNHLGEWCSLGEGAVYPWDELEVLKQVSIPFDPAETV